MSRNNDQFQYDIVIPVHKKDLQILEYCISFARKNLIGARRIIVISAEKHSNSAEWFDEKLYPFSIDLVRSYVGDSCGWYFQQLLKLYAPLVIPDILENVLVLDSDTVFFRRVRMFNSKGVALCNISKDTKICRKPFDIKVAAHIEKLLPALAVKNLPKKFQTLSGISHHMMFNRNLISEMMKKIEDHDVGKDPFYKIFLKHSDTTHSASEYQLYYCFLLIYHPDKIQFRKLRYKNTADINIKKYLKRFKYHYCSFHHYLRSTKFTSFRAKLKNFFTKTIAKFFVFEEWNVGIAKCLVSDFLTIPNQEIYWLRPKKFRADPFGFIDDSGNIKIFYEDYNLFKKRGRILCDSLDKNLQIISTKTALETKGHISYPYIFSDQNQKFALVESYKSNSLSLYKINEDSTFEKVKDLITNCAIVDPSIIKHDGIWWLFFNINNEGDENLYLAYSDDLLGEWKMHKKNPVKTNINSARSAGEIFYHENNLYRPAQNCSKTYGGSITINRINVLNSEEFSEAEYIEIFPNQLSTYPKGIHHVSSLRTCLESPLGKDSKQVLSKNMTLVDGKRKIFILHKPLISLFRNLKKIFLVN